MNYYIIATIIIVVIIAVIIFFKTRKTPEEKVKELEKKLFFGFLSKPERDEIWNELQELKKSLGIEEE